MARIFAGLVAGHALRPAAAAAAVLVLHSSAAFALYSGFEYDTRRFDMNDDYFIDVLPMEIAPPQRATWREAELRPLELGGARGYRFALGSVTGSDAWEEHDLRLRYAIDDPWTWTFRYFRGLTMEGTYSHFQTGMDARLAEGWWLSLFGEPASTKEYADLGCGIVRERLAEPDRILYRWELRAIWPNLYFGEKNDVMARYDRQPFDLQLSARASLGDRGWIALEVDRDFRSETLFLTNPAAPPLDQDYRFGYDRWEAELRGAFELSPSRRLWWRFSGEESDRDRDYFALPASPPPDPIFTNYYADSSYTLRRAQVEWWRTLESGRQLAVGFQRVRFKETIRYQAPTFLVYVDDRTDNIIYAHYRIKVGDELWMTFGLYHDFLDRTRTLDSTLWERGDPLGKMSFTLEMPSFSKEEVRTSWVTIGGSFGFYGKRWGGAYARYVVTF